MRAGRFLIAFTAAALSVLAGVAGVNYAVDVRGVYHDRHAFAQDYVRRLQASRQGLVAVPVERPVKLELARVTEARCFVIGSSRAMTLGRRQLAELGFDCPMLANLAVSGAGFEDVQALAGQLANKAAGATLFLGIDPWTLRANADLRYKEVPHAYAQGRARLGLGTAAVDQGGAEKLTNLLNGQYLWANLRHVLSGERPLAVVEVAGGQAGDHDTITNPDGSQTYSRAYRAAPPPADAAVGNGSTKIARPYVDSAVAGEFEQVVAYFQDRGARVVLVLTPYHPKVFTCGSAKVCEALAEVERWARALAARRGLTVVGGFDPRPFGLGREYFHDDLHLDVSGIGHLAGAPHLSDRP
jgi:hypothetical protein